MLISMRGYSIVSLAIGVFYVAAVVALIGGVSIGAWLWLQADQIARSGPGTLSVPSLVRGLQPGQLRREALLVGAGGLTFALACGFVAQLLSMLRNQAVNSDRQVQLLSELLAMREQEMSAIAARRVAPCEGCGKLAGVERIESGQWVCVECRRVLRSA